MTALNLVHRVRLPPGEKVQLLPAVVLVHGWTGTENSMQIFHPALPPGVVAVSPRGPIVAEEGYGWLDRQAAGDLAYAAGMEALQEFVSRLPAVYPVDPARVVLMGFSQGAAMSLALMLKEPGLVAGTAALAGYLPAFARGWALPARLTGKPVFMAHGAEDTTVPLAEAASAKEVLSLAGAEVTYCEYLTGHKMNQQGMQDLKQWLAGHV